MPFNKEDNLILKAEARYNPLFNSGIAFYNLDTNNRLGFQMKRKGVIVPLSEINVQSYISLIAQDGSNIVDNLKFENELQGVLSYRIPAEFLKHTGNVHAEVHITTNGKDDTVVMGEFDFEIKDASINKLPADMKIGYIRMFDDLKKTIEQKVADIEAAIANGQDYVTAIQNASADAKQAIDSSVAGAKADIDAKVSTATTDLNKTATNATKAITDTAKSATDSVDADLKEFKDTVANNGFLKPSDVANYQKYALTGADGVAKRISGSDCNTLTELGFYYLPSPINQPSGWGSLYLLVIPGSVTNTTAYYKQIGFQYGTGKIAIRDRKSGAIGDTSLLTDWVELESTTGAQAKADKALSDSKVYADNTFIKKEKTLFEGAAASVDTKITLIDDYTKYDLLYFDYTFNGSSTVPKRSLATPVYKQALKSNATIQIYDGNVSDPDAKSVYAHELQIQALSTKQLSIVLDNMTNVVNGTATLNANAFKIVRVIGVNAT